MFRKNIKKEFYTYVYLNPLKPGIYKYENYSFDFEPFYVGKGKGRRHLDHLFSQEGCDEKINLIKQLIESNNQPIIVKTKEDILEDEAFEEEKYLIKIIGRKILKEGPLLNLQPGGEGFSGWIITENWIEKNKLGSIERWNKIGPEGRKLHGEKIKKSFDNLETKEKLRKNMINQWSDPERRTKRISIQQLPHVKEIKSKTSIEKLSRSYVVVSPNNIIFKTNRLRDFSKEHNLCYDALLSVSGGKSISNKGWICFLDIDGEKDRILNKIEILKQEKKNRKLQQNLNQVGKHIHNEDSKKRIGNSLKGNKYGFGYKHTKENIEKIRTSSLEMWKKRKENQK